jgi:glycerol-3-phosphate dehydrogenase
LHTRSGLIARMKEETFDLAVIGGGITGAGVALDARGRGLRVALVEKGDFAAGTSSRSSKLIHGGLRYLGHLEFKLVGEALSERAVLSEIAPHLAAPLAFLIPIYSRGTPSPLGSSRLKLGFGLWLYDLLAGRKKIARHRWLTPRQSLELAPALESRGLKGCFLYYDALTDDSRLVIEVIKAAALRGAAVANYARARGLLSEGGRVTGIEVEDLLGAQQFSLKARVVVNAAGVWSDQIARLSGNPTGKRLRPSKGIHIVLPSDVLGNQTAVLIPSLGERRFFFVIPWQGRTLVGTTDTDYSGDLDKPVAESEEINRVIRSAARFFPGAALTARDVISSFAGLRPLVGGGGSSTAELSRKEEIAEGPAGMISIFGGKLTTYRRMAERAVDLAAARLENRVRPCETREIQLAGGPAPAPSTAPEVAEEFNVQLETVEHLMRAYGGNFRALLEIARRSPELKSRLVAELPHIEAEVVYAARYEMAATLDDFLARRTRITLLVGDHGQTCAARVAELLGREHGWSQAEIEKATAGFAA